MDDNAFADELRAALQHAGPEPTLPSSLIPNLRRSYARRVAARRVGVAGGPLAAAAAIAVVVSVSGPGAPPASAATVLNNAANAATTVPAGHGQWAYTSTLTITNDAGTHINRTQTWLKVDGTDGLIRLDRDGRTEEHRSKTSALFAGERPSLYNPTYNYLASLPTDPAKLRAEIYAQATDNLATTLSHANPSARTLYTVDQWAFQRIASLAEGAAPPALKAALYRVAATVPDIELVQDVADSSGRHGIGIAHTVNNAGDKITLIFDRNTYQILGRGGTVHDGRTEGDAILATGLVEQPGQTP